MPVVHRSPHRATVSASTWLLACLLAVGACSGSVDTPASRDISDNAGASAAQCTPSLTDPANCGQCGRSCGLGGTCVTGACVCAGELASCAAGCVDTRTDRTNCGVCGRACGLAEECQNNQCVPAASACTPACSAGSVCSAGRCVCPASLTQCGNACVDTRTQPQDCGACGNACAAGQLCQASMCACPTGQLSCNNVCADAQTSSTNCGACGHACSSGEVCMAGVCRGPSGDDGCIGGSARELSLREISVYQSVKIPLMQKLAPVTPRVADVVEGRATLFRVFVDPSAAFTAREISARLTIKSDGSEDHYFAKQQITKASSDTDTASTFQLYVPADKIQASTSYSVELVECAAASGSPAAPRFPATGETPLQTRKTGTLKITVIPVTANSLSPDTSETALANYRSYLEAMYPIEKAEITVGTKLTTSYPINWTTLIEQIRTQRQTDRPAADVYYFGLVKPLATLREYCRGGCTAGIGYVGTATQASTYAAVGLAFGDETSAATMAHEVGHNHGRNHAPCAPGNNISGVDAKYPYSGAKLGTWGYDSRKKVFFNPDTTFDIMGYCDPKWISDYTYKGLTDRVVAINTPKLELASLDQIAAYQVMVVDPDGPRWSQPFVEPAEPFGTPEMAEALDIDGHPIEQVTVYRTFMSDLDTSTILVPEPKSGWNAIRVAGALALPFSAPVTVPAPE